jgi:hypothetical protein
MKTRFLTAVISTLALVWFSHPVRATTFAAGETAQIDLIYFNLSSPKYYTLHIPIFSPDGNPYGYYESFPPPNLGGFLGGGGSNGAPFDLTVGASSPLPAGSYSIGGWLFTGAQVINNQVTTLPGPLSMGTPYLLLCDLPNSVLCTQVDGTVSLSSVPGDAIIQASLVPSVPLPSALPLFATGLGALGLLGWRRKRKIQHA